MQAVFNWLSQDILLEYEEIIQMKYGLKTSESFMALLTLLPNVHYAHPFYKWHLITADPDDNKYCDCAISGAVYYLVTEDKHFDVLKELAYPSLNIISTSEFARMIG